MHFALETFGNPWTLLIVRDLMFKGRSTYTEFLHAEEGIATNVLADRLTRLEADGIVTATRDPATGRATRYRLTDKGVDLLPVMLEIIGWSAAHDPKTEADPSFVKRLRTDRRALETEIRRELQEQP